MNLETTPTCRTRDSSASILPTSGICILLNHYTFVVIPITSKGLGAQFVIYKSQLRMEGEVKDFQFLHNSILPSFAVLCVALADSPHS